MEKWPGYKNPVIKKILDRKMRAELALMGLSSTQNPGNEDYVEPIRSKIPGELNSFKELERELMRKRRKR